MAKLYPLLFNPIFKERLWGGRKLETLYHKRIPAGALIGESWEISDRPGDASVIANGPLSGRSLRQLMEQCPEALLGRRHPMPSRFPLLIKALDSKQTLSLQVHPPPALAEKMGGEPKTEMWYVADAEPGAELFAGLKRGVTRTQFEQKLATQTVADCFHRIPVKRGDSLFLPSGRVHALGAGLVIFEIQQNSDTTYRVFDWNRLDRDGKPRELHVQQSLACIDFNDFEPALLPSQFSRDGNTELRPLVKTELFTANCRRLATGAEWPIPAAEMRIIALLTGQAKIGTALLTPGTFCLVPADAARATLNAITDAELLEIFL